MVSRCHRIIFSVVSIIFFSMAVSFVPASAESGGHATLVVTVNGIRSVKGQVKIAIFNSSEKWLGSQPVYSSTIDVKGPSVTWKINDVPSGDYGIAVLDDENSNGKMDKNILGLPLEAYGFSNNVRATFGAPKWEDAKFIVKAPTTEVSIEVK